MLRRVQERFQRRKELRGRDAQGSFFCRLLWRDSIAGSGRAVKGSNRGDSSIMRKIFHFLRTHWKAGVVAAAVSLLLDLIDFFVGTFYKDAFFGCLCAMFVTVFCAPDHTKEVNHDK